MARVLAASVLPTPGSPSSRIGWPMRTARKSAVASGSSARYPAFSRSLARLGMSGTRSDIALGGVGERGAAAGAAEVPGTAGVFDLERGGRDGDVHPAHRVGGGHRAAAR